MRTRDHDPDSQDVGERLDAVERRVANAADEVDRIARSVVSAIAVTKMGRTDAERFKETGNRDEIFSCPKCMRLLGYYDVGADEIRLKRSTHLAFVRLGVGGKMRVHCFGCGAETVLNYSLPLSPEARAEAIAEAVELAVIGALGTTDADAVGPVVVSALDVIEAAARRPAGSAR